MTPRYRDVRPPNPLRSHPPRTRSAHIRRPRPDRRRREPHSFRTSRRFPTIGKSGEGVGEGAGRVGLTRRAVVFWAEHY